jgi:hypothetical protein
LITYLVGAELLEKASVEVTRVVDQDIDATEPLNGCIDRGVRIFGASHVELVNQQVVVIADCCRNLATITPRCDDSMTCGERSLDDIDTEPTAGAGDEPNLLCVHVR